MKDKNQPLIEEIIEKINRIKMRRRSRLERKHEGRGAGYVLSYLYYNGNKVLPSELGKMMNVTTPRVTAILNNLEAQDLIIRSISPEDRRNIYITLSNKGYKVVKERLLRQRKDIQLLVEHLNEEDVHAFIRVLDAIYRLMDEQGWGNSN